MYGWTISIPSDTQPNYIRLAAGSAPLNRIINVSITSPGGWNSSCGWNSSTNRKTRLSLRPISCWNSSTESLYLSKCSQLFILAPGIHSNGKTSNEFQTIARGVTGNLRVHWWATMLSSGIGVWSNALHEVFDNWSWTWFKAYAQSYPATRILPERIETNNPSGF
jgi:hypothetical protein